MYGINNRGPKTEPCGRINNRGPKTELCGTSLFTQIQWVATVCKRLCRRLENKLSMLPSIKVMWY